MPSRDILLDLPLRITRTANQQRTYQYCYDYHRKVKDLHLEGMTTFVYPALMGFTTACSIPIRLCPCPSSVLLVRFRHSRTVPSFPRMRESILCPLFVIPAKAGIQSSSFPLYGMLIDGSMAWSAATVNRISRCRGLSLQFFVYLLAVSNVYDDRTVFAFNSKHGTICARPCFAERA